MGFWRLQPVYRRMLPVRAFLLLAVCFASTLGQELCVDDGTVAFDGIVPDAENNLLIVKGANFWKLDGNLTYGFSVSAGYPKKLYTRWPAINFTESLDLAIFDAMSNLTYFVLDKQGWAYNDTELLPGYPKPIKDDPFLGPANQNFHDDLSLKRLAKLAENYFTLALFPIDLSHAYFFGTSQYAKFKMPNGPIEPGYPKSMVPFWYQCPEFTNND